MRISEIFEVFEIWGFRILTSIITKLIAAKILGSILEIEIFSNIRNKLFEVICEDLKECWIQNWKIKQYMSCYTIIKVKIDDLKNIKV